MQPYTVLNCHSHDYLELACIKGHPLKIALTDGSTIIAKPVTIKSYSDKTEWLQLSDDAAVKQIRLDHILTITSIVHSAESTCIEINKPSE